MMLDEWIRAFCYFLMFPAFVYFGLIARNRRQFTVAATYLGLGAFFLLLLVGLVTGHYHHAIPALLNINTGVVVVLCAVVTWRATSIMLAALLAGDGVCVALQEIEHD